MGLFDIFSSKNADAAAQAQEAALLAGQKQGTADLGQGYGDIKTSYAAGLSPLLQNYSAQTGGTTQLANLLGFGPSGGAGIQTTLENLPGYQFTRDQGTQNVERANAAQGYGGGGPSGNVDKAIADYTTNLANTNYGNYVNQLLPYLGASTQTGGQIAATNASLGGQLNQNRTTQAGLDYGTNVGIGNAQASADLAKNNASANALNAIMQGGKFGAQLFGFL